MPRDINASGRTTFRAGHGGYARFQNTDGYASQYPEYGLGVVWVMAHQNADRRSGGRLDVLTIFGVEMCLVQRDSSA